ncbi:MAG: ATP-binding protein [Candidatus Electrothrix communis]|nr:MAG: ATP-binding protein [Candidatus Electrothrix communis]
MQYVKECLRLLYWIYFKPYTLKRHVQAICPEITDPYKDNIYRRSAAARANPQLQRYDEQGWWLTVLVPIVLTFLYAPLVEGIAHLLVGPGALQFNWWKSSFVLFGWLLGQVFVRAIRKRLGEKFAIPVAVIAMALLAFISLLSEYGFVSKAVFSVMFGVGTGMAFGVMGSCVGAFGVVFGVAFGVVFGAAGGVVGSGVVAFGVVCGVASGAVFGVLGGVMGSGMVATGLVFGVAIVVVLGVAGGVGGVGGGVAGGLTYILGVLRVYFYLPELLWTILLKFFPVFPSHRLPLLPFRFDQLIHLPLPFLPGFIAEAYQENQAAARQTIDYLITSTNQQKTARKAKSLIAVEECSRCQTARDITAIREQLSWISKEPPPGLAACLEISQDVTAALAASSPYRQTQQLDKVLQQIDRQRNALATASAREATSFGSVLDSWQRILETARRTLREQAKNSDEIPQVYLAGPALDPNKAGPLFKGRSDLFRQIETLTLSTQHPTLVMHGGRRSGKTSTLNYLPKWLPSDILPLLIDGQSLATTSTLSGFAEDFADQINRSARKVHSLKLPVLDSVTPSADPFVTLRRWIDAVEQAVPEKTLLLCLDEFERLDEIVTATSSRAPLNFLRHLIQHRDRWTLLFTGAQTPEELPAYWSDYLINCETLRVSYLAEADCLELIQRPVEGFPDIYPPDVAYAIWDLTGGQPYFTQLLCHELVEQLNKKKEKIVQMDDLETVLPAVFERGYQVFREFWETLTNEQRELLLAVAEEQETTEEERRAASLLVRKEILAPERRAGSGWLFRVPLLCRWIVEGRSPKRSTLKGFNNISSG